MFLNIYASNHIDSDDLNFVILLKIWTLQKYDKRMSTLLISKYWR